MKDHSFSYYYRRLIIYLKVARLDHWFKNLMVLVGGTVVIWRPEIDIGSLPVALGYLALALLVTCFASGANYITNEILDGPRDRIHPTKRFRSVPAGAVSIPKSWGLAGLFVLSSVATAWLFLPWQRNCLILT
jgi:decaprenyl-phosphate phosphoribosyltransferase